MQKYLIKGRLPEGRMYYNIAQKVLQPLVEKGHERVSQAAAEVQKVLNEQAGIGLQVQLADLDQDKLDGIINKMCASEDFDDVKRLLGDPVVNFHQTVVDNTLKANADLHHKVGLSSEIIRVSESHCCPRCTNLAGTYKYPEDAQKNVFKRQNNCRCKTEYSPGNGKRQNVYSKTRNESSEQLEKRKNTGLRPMSLR